MPCLWGHFWVVFSFYFITVFKLVDFKFIRLITKICVDDTVAIHTPHHSDRQQDHADHGRPRSAEHIAAHFYTSVTYIIDSFIAPCPWSVTEVRKLKTNRTLPACWSLPEIMDPVTKNFERTKTSARVATSHRRR